MYQFRRKTEFERLQKEYERVKEFHEQVIEKKMREARLKRLFREIEAINEANLNFRRRHPGPMLPPKTPEDLRRETIAKSKELGKEYSKMNAYLLASARYAAPRAMRTDGVSVNQQRMMQCQKGISYGNERSRFNLERLETAKKRAKPVKPLPTEPDAKDVMDPRQCLKNRIEYGNQRSNFNKRKRLAMAARKEHPLSAKASRQVALAQGMADRLFQALSRRCKRHMERDLPPGRECYRCLAQKFKCIRARENWKCLTAQVLEHLRKERRNEEQQRVEEYVLRTISNATHLPYSTIKIQPAPPPPPKSGCENTFDGTENDDEDDEEQGHEKIVSVHHFVANDLPPASGEGASISTIAMAKALPPLPLAEETDKPELKQLSLPMADASENATAETSETDAPLGGETVTPNGPKSALADEQDGAAKESPEEVDMNKVVDILEPFINEIARKDAVDKPMGVKQLKGIFDHANAQ